ncbi:MAG: TIGR02147 family protein [Myxococcales bacterium]|nr:TIGR02147 family protein [Myxococcales bacterium]
MRDEWYDATDWRSFVEKVIEGRELTRRELAKRVDLSESLVSMMLSGRRPMDPARVEVFAEVLGLDAEAVAWFGALVDLESRSERARRTALATVTSRLQQRAAPDPAADTHDAIAHWPFEVLTELVACEGFRPDPRWIAQTIHPAITPEEAQRTLQLAMRLGRVVVDDQGRYAITNVRTDSVLQKDRAVASAVQRKAFAELAAQAMFRPGNERHDGSVTMAVSEERADLILARLRELEQELVQLAIDDPGPRNRVLHLGIQLFPVSEYTDTDVDPEGEG